MAVPELLRVLLTADGPSGHEGPVARVWREAAATFAEVSSDTLGTSFARVRAGEGAPVLALVGHIDEIGVAITNIADDGMLAFSVVGGMRPEMLAAQRLRILGREGTVRGVLVASRLMRGRDRPKLELSDLHIDIGAKSREDAERLVRTGDAGVWEGDPVELPNGRVVSKALDNRLGAYVALEAARRIAEAGGAAFEVVAVAAVQEEIGLGGAITSTFALEPDVAITIDVTHTTDVPGGDPKAAGKVELGAGATITRGPILNTHVTELLARAAEEDEIPHTFEVYTGSTHTDADAVHIARAGVPTGLVGLPLRYMHSPCELASLDDVESAVRIVVGFASRLTPETSFLR